MDISATVSSNEVKQKALELGVHKVGITVPSAISPQDVQRLNSWLELGYQADMMWMSNSKRRNVTQLMPEVKSLVCVALNYYTPHQHQEITVEGGVCGKISRYAWGRDYHKIMHKKLKALSIWLESLHPDIKTRYYADTGPVQDKVWAEKAGIGWIAKNGNVISRSYGSWIFLGEVLTNLELTPDTPHTKHCGTCTRCIDACPTGAIVADGVVDANRCIAYHTIENRSAELPENIKLKMQGWVAGCDICQDVCPWNQRFATETSVLEFQPYPENLAPSLTQLAEISDEEWDKRFTASALRRIKPLMLRRNARANLEAFQANL
jgi:epoxyqueuosine reductase